METLSEYGIVIARPSQSILLMPADFTLPRAKPPTIKDKIICILKIVGIVFLCLAGLILVGISVWGVIKYPPLIIFFFIGLLFGTLTNR